MKQDKVKQIAYGDVVLRVDRIDANGRVCPVGTQIAPSVDGWPAHRVAHELLHGYAVNGTGNKPSYPDAMEPKIDRKDVEKLVKKIESLQEDKRALTVELSDQQTQIVELTKANEVLIAQIDELHKELFEVKAEKQESKKAKG